MPCSIWCLLSQCYHLWLQREKKARGIAFFLFLLRKQYRSLSDLWWLLLCFLLEPWVWRQRCLPHDGSCLLIVWLWQSYARFLPLGVRATAYVRPRSRLHHAVIAGNWDLRETGVWFWRMYARPIESSLTAESIDREVCRLSHSARLVRVAVRCQAALSMNVDWILEVTTAGRWCLAPVPVLNFSYILRRVRSYLS